MVKESDAKVLITDSEHRKALAAARSLGGRGVQIVSGSSSFLNPTNLSKYVKKTFRYPDPIRNPSSFVQTISEFAKKRHIDVILPFEGKTVEVLSKHLDSFNDTVNIPVPRYDIFELGQDKSKTLKKALDLDIPCPETYFIEELENVKKLEREVEYPIVIKPRISSGSRGIEYVSSSEELAKVYKRVHREFPYPIIQEYIPQEGKKFQVLLLVTKDNEVKANLTQELLRQFPVSGGPGTLWGTIRYSEITEKSIELVKSLDWYGVACVEFITDPRDGEPKLMEINPRFWGTLNLSIKVGVNFPLLLTKMALGEDFDTVTYEGEEQYCQWLLPGDMLNFIFNKDRLNQEFGYFFFNKPDKLHHAILSKDDPLPVLGKLAELPLGIFKKENIKNVFSRGK